MTPRGPLARISLSLLGGALIATAACAPGVAPSTGRTVATAPTAPPAAATVASTVSPSPSVPRPAPGAVLAPSAIPSASAYERVGGREIGLTFEVPADWQKDAFEEVWRSTVGAPASVGLARRTPEQAPDDRSFLPNHAEVLSQEQVRLGWGSGTRYAVEVTPPAAGGPPPLHEVHVVVRLGGKTVYDLFSQAQANDPASRQAADQAREHLLRSVALVGG